MNSTKRRGQVLLAAVFALVVVGALGLGAVSLQSSGIFAAAKTLSGIQSLNLAEGGGRYVLARVLASDSDWSDNANFGPVTLGSGNFSVSYLNRSQNDCAVQVMSNVGGTNRTVRFALNRASQAGPRPGNFDYGMYAGRPGGGSTLYIAGSAAITGDFYYYGPIWMMGSARQSGGTIYSTSIQRSGSASYASWEAAPALDLPVWDNSPYDPITAEALQPAESGDLYLGYMQTLNLNGQTKHYRNVYIYGWPCTIRGPGTICATAAGSGDIFVAYGAAIGRGVRFIANNSFYYYGGVSTPNSFEVYAKRNVWVLNGLTVPAGSLLYSRGTYPDGIYLYGHATGTFLAPYGYIDMGFGYTWKGLFYSDRLGGETSGTLRGALVCRTPSIIAGSFRLIYDPTYLPGSVAGFGGGSAPALTVSDWQESY